MQSMNTFDKSSMVDSLLINVTNPLMKSSFPANLRIKFICETKKKLLGRKNAHRRASELRRKLGVAMESPKLR